MKQTIKIGNVCEILNGYAFKSDNYVNCGIRIIRIANVQKGYIEDNSPVFYPENSAEAQKYALQENDLLMSLTGNVGRVALLKKEFLPAALNQRVACIRLKSTLLSKGFLYCFLNNDYFEKKAVQSSKGVAQKNMSTEWLKEYEIPFYPMPLQRKIEDSFARLQEIIDSKNRQLEKLDELVKSRFSEQMEVAA